MARCDQAPRDSQASAGVPYISSPNDLLMLQAEDDPAQQPEHIVPKYAETHKPHKVNTAPSCKLSDCFAFLQAAVSTTVVKYS
jgi:hypothetical protein